MIPAMSGHRSEGVWGFILDWALVISIRLERRFVKVRSTSHTERSVISGQVLTFLRPAVLEEAEAPLP